MKKIVMAMLVIGLAATVAQAAIIQITPAGSPAPGLSAYIVTAVGTEGKLVAGIADVHLYGSVHQVWPTQAFGPPPAKSPMVGDLVAPFADPLWELLDTHLLIDPADHLTSPGFGVDEGNDGVDPAGVGPLLPPGFEVFPGVVGLGDLYFTGVAPQITLVPFVPAIDFLYVVTTGPAYLDVTLIDEPEPATLALLLLGGLALLRRKRPGGAGPKYI